MSADFPALVDHARTLPPLSLPAFVRECTRALTVAEQRLETALAPAPTPTHGSVDDDGPDYAPLEVAAIMNLRSKSGARKGEYSTGAVRNLAERPTDPMPCYRHPFRIPRKPFWEWRRKQMQKGVVPA